MAVCKCNKINPYTVLISTQTVIKFLEDKRKMDKDKSATTI